MEIKAISIIKSNCDLSKDIKDYNILIDLILIYINRHTETSTKDYTYHIKSFKRFDNYERIFDIKTNLLHVIKTALRFLYK